MTNDYSISILQYWFYGINIEILAQFSKKGLGFCLLGQNFNAGFINQHCKIFSHIFSVTFLIDAIKPNVENKLKTCFFLRLCLEEGSRERIK